MPWADHGIRWHNFPFGLGKGAAVAAGGADFAAVYLGDLDTDPVTVIQAVETLLDPDNHPAMFHCAAGKDRTGVLSALLLDVLGVPHDAIAEDYAMSAAGTGPILARLAAQPPYERMLAGYTVEEHLPDPNVMLDFLARLGGVLQWLTRHGVPGERGSSASARRCSRTRLPPGLDGDEQDDVAEGHAQSGGRRCR